MAAEKTHSRVNHGAGVLLAVIIYLIVSMIGVVAIWGCALVLKVPYWILMFWIPLGAAVFLFIALKTRSVLKDFRNNGGLYYVLGVAVFGIAIMCLGLMTR